MAQSSARATAGCAGACYRRLDAKSANYLIGLGLNPYEGRVCMRENNWEYAKDASAGMGNWYADERGEATCHGGKLASA